MLPPKKAALAGPLTLSQKVRVLPVIRALIRGGHWSRTDVLTAIGVVFWIVAITIAIFQLREQQRSNEIALSPTSTAEPFPRLELGAVEVIRSQDIDATVDNRIIGGPSQIKVSASVIDVTLKNLGSVPALITRADFHFQKVDQLQNCFGAGPGSLSALYDVKVPTDPGVTTNPFMINRDIRFVVGPNSVDRLAFTVGPMSSGFSEWPWIYQIDVSLVQDSGASLNIGTVLLLEPAGKPFTQLQELKDSGKLMAPECLARDAALLQEPVRTTGLSSPELLEFDREMEKYSNTP